MNQIHLTAVRLGLHYIYIIIYNGFFLYEYLIELCYISRNCCVAFTNLFTNWDIFFRL